MKPPLGQGKPCPYSHIIPSGTLQAKRFPQRFQRDDKSFDKAWTFG